MIDIIKDLNKVTDVLVTDEFISVLFLYIINIIILFIIVYILKKIAHIYFKDRHTRYKVKKILTFIFYIIVAGLTIYTVAQHNKHLTLFIGVVGAGIAFALQELILSTAGFFSIFLSNLFKLGDRIKIGDIIGDVIDIGVTKTTLMEVGGWISSDNYSGRIVQVPNSKIYKENILNYSSDFPFLWDEIKLPVKYNSDLQKTEKIILEVANDVLSSYINKSKSNWADIVEKYSVEKSKEDPDVTYTLTENWIEFELRYVVGYKERQKIKYILSKKIYEKIKKIPKDITLAQRIIEVKNIK